MSLHSSVVTRVTVFCTSMVDLYTQAPSDSGSFWAASRASRVMTSTS